MLKKLDWRNGGEEEGRDALLLFKRLIVQNVKKSMAASPRQLEPAVNMTTLIVEVYLYIYVAKIILSIQFNPYNPGRRRGLVNLLHVYL